MNDIAWPSSDVLWFLAAAVATLAVGSVIRLWALRGADRRVAGQRLASLRTWWLVAATVILAALFGRTASVVLFALISALALREYLRMSTDARILPLRVAAYALLALSYLWIYLDRRDVFIVFLPVAGAVVLGTCSVVLQRVRRYSRTIAAYLWGLLVTSYLLAHAVLLFDVPEATATEAGAAGLFLYLIVLTEVNDISQALAGRWLGRRKIIPRVSPNKTWEGFAGGVLTTVVAATALAKWLTPLTHWQAAVAGGLLAIAGFFGDLNVSAMKRDAGIKDSGTLLPGQGGMLDRVDSLTFTAPLFYYYLMFLV